METTRILENLGLTNGGTPNLAGLLLFGQAPQRLCPAFDIKAVAFPGTVLHDRHYLDSEDIDGNLLEQYRRSLAFIKRNLRHVQRQQDFNTLGQLEVPEEVFEELLVNALIHRDYFVSASIRIMIFADRIELISPGHLPDVLDTEKIRFGLSNRPKTVAQQLLLMDQYIDREPIHRQERTGGVGLLAQAPQDQGRFQWHRIEAADR
nr:hypothetical protein [Pseudomonas sp. MWU13-2100]